jgi:peptidyl-prolyl cis-trans isomerase SurA
MRRARSLGLLFGLLAMTAVRLPAQEIIDRIVARVENDIILLSQIRALSRYQQLVEGKSESDAQILDRLINQWIVRNEADTAQFPRPSEDDITRGVDRVQSSFTSPEEYQERRTQVGLTDRDVRNMVAAQLYLSNYLDSRFRPSAQIGPKEIEDFYQKSVIPRAKARGQDPPSLDAARDIIRDALIQSSIDEQAERWLNESRGRVKVDKFLDEAAQ